MSKIVQAFRFFVGLSMVAAGVSLAAPLVVPVVSVVVNAYGETVSRGVLLPTGSPSTGPTGQPNAMGNYAAHTIPDVRTSMAGQPSLADANQADGQVALAMAAAMNSPVILEQTYSPPTPPQPLPQVASELSRGAPGLDVTYRSTLDIPPPPLLDIHAPPPLAAGHTTATAAVAPRGLTTDAYAVPPAGYCVRDGDDLTSIATQFYGHPGAANSIWLANRDRLTDPTLLPIGLELRIPSSWSVPATRASQSSQPVIEPAGRPRGVRVAPGETLETLAQRFYGDRAMATRIWEANRNELRSPALLVPGMELRLP